MIFATHIIGLTVLESGALLSSHRDLVERREQYAAQIAQRWETIRASGELVARRHLPDWTNDRARTPGRSFVYDEIADEGRYVFLETHSRYEDIYPPARWGWRFDAEQLVRADALVCDADLGGAFDDLIWRTCEEVAATLPRLPRISTEELADFATLLGEDDPELLAFVAQESENPLEALHDAVRGLATDAPLPADVVERTRALAAERCRLLKVARRISGGAALTLLRTGGYCEIVVPDRLPLAWAVEEIRGER